MTNVNFLFTEMWYLERNYGVQAINFSLIEKLKPRLAKSHFTLLLTKSLTEGDALFAQKNGLGLLEFPGIYKAPNDADIIEKKYIYPKVIKNISGKSAKEFIDAFKCFSVVLDTDGIEYTGSLGSYAKTSFIQSLSKENEIKYLKYTKSFGPFDMEGSRIRRTILNYETKKKFNELPFLFVRGKYNLEQVLKLGLNIPTYSFPDVSLSMKPESKSWARTFLEKKGISFSKPLIGISPTYVISSLQSAPNNTCGANHELLCERLIEKFRSEECDVIIIPHSILDGKTITGCDLALGKEIYSRLVNTENVFLLEDVNLTYKQVRAIIGLLDFYMTGRYHSVCSALYMAVPTVCFSWHIKYKDVLSLFLDDYLVLDSRTTSVEDSMELILKYYNDQSWFDKSDVKKRLIGVNNEIDKSIDLVVEEIKRSRGA